MAQELCFAGFYKPQYGSDYPLRVAAMRFRVTLFGRRASEKVFEARDFREASEIVKSRFPEHKGYSIVSVT
jgi:hypothetical protein